ncbi:hypothetical protein KAH81_02340 [bacterium]|nr:hypothetical protein [bacterium]
MATGELTLNITAPLTLIVDSISNNYSPNPFSINCLVTDTTSSVINGITATINNSTVKKGNHNFTWDCSSSPSGIYFIKATYTDKTFVRRAVLMK